MDTTWKNILQPHTVVRPPNPPSPPPPPPPIQSQVLPAPHWPTGIMAHHTLVPFQNSVWPFQTEILPFEKVVIPFQNETCFGMGALWFQYRSCTLARHLTTPQAPPSPPPPSPGAPPSPSAWRSAPTAWTSRHPSACPGISSYPAASPSLVLHFQISSVSQLSDFLSNFIYDEF